MKEQNERWGEHYKKKQRMEERNVRNGGRNKNKESKQLKSITWGIRQMACINN